MTTRTYEVNADNNRSYSSDNAKKVASVAVAWEKQGIKPQAYASIVGDKVECRQVEVTTVRETAKALLQA